MNLCCPQCGNKEEVSQLYGNWWARCNSCGHMIKVIGMRLSQREERKENITCPECGYSEENELLPSKTIIITCPDCKYQWEQRKGSKLLNGG